MISFSSRPLTDGLFPYASTSAHPLVTIREFPIGGWLPNQRMKLSRRGGHPWWYAQCLFFACGRPDAQLMRDSLGSDSRTLVRSLRPFLVIVSLIGLIVSLIGHVAILLGVDVPANPVNVLLVFGVVLLLGSGVEGYLRRREIRQRGATAIFQGAPGMKWLSYGAAGYFVLDFFFATGQWAGNVRSEDPGSARIASAAGIAIFAHALAVFYASYRRANVGPST